MPRSILLAIAATLLASCAVGEANTPGLESGATAREQGTANAGGSTPLAASTDTSITTDSPGQSVVAGSGPESSNPESSDVDANPDVTTSTDADVDTELVPTLCDSLLDDGYETRKAALDAAVEETLAGAEAECGEAFARLVDAREIEDRMAAFNEAGNGFSATNLVCDEGDFSLDVTNNAEHPIGVHAALELRAEGDPAPIGSTLEPLVVWNMEPGSTVQLTGDYDLSRDSDATLTCRASLTAFDATAGDADASLGGEPRQPELSGEDPALWLPALVAQAEALPASNIPDSAAAVEDVRSSAYGQVLASVTDDVAEPPASVTISVCSGSIDQPDDRTMSLIYFAEPTDSTLDVDSVLQHAIFRRGNDGQWRWLTDSKYFDSRDYWSCGTPSVDR